MLADADRLHRTVDQVLKAGIASHKPKVIARAPVDMSLVARECVDLALSRHHLQRDAIMVEAHDEGPLMVRGEFPAR